MKLRNSFSNETRHLFFDTRFNCWDCGRNDTELHHISGRTERESDSPINAAVVCKKCHSRVGHTEEEEKRYFRKNLQYLTNVAEYTITEKDLKFINSNKRLQEVIHDNLEIHNNRRHTV